MHFIDNIIYRAHILLLEATFIHLLKANIASRLLEAVKVKYVVISSKALLMQNHQPALLSFVYVSKLGIPGVKSMIQEIQEILQHPLNGEKRREIGKAAIREGCSNLRKRLARENLRLEMLMHR